MLSVRLAKEAHFTQAAEDRKVLGPRSIIRLAEPTTRSASALLQDQDYPNSLQQGPLTGSQGEAPHLHWVARLLGHVCTAFLVACATVSLVGILSSTRLSFPPCRSLAGSPNSRACCPSQVVLAIQSLVFRQAHPRAPPIRVTVQR